MDHEAFKGRGPSVVRDPKPLVDVDDWLGARIWLATSTGRFFKWSAFVWLALVIALLWACLSTLQQIESNTGELVHWMKEK